MTAYDFRTLPVSVHDGNSFLVNYNGDYVVNISLNGTNGDKKDISKLDIECSDSFLTKMHLIDEDHLVVGIIYPVNFNMAYDQMLKSKEFNYLGKDARKKLQQIRDKIIIAHKNISGPSKGQEELERKINDMLVLDKLKALR